MRIAPLFAVTVGAAVIASASCTLFNGLTARETDAGPDAIAGDDAAVDADPCVHAYPPGKPDAADDAGVSFVVVGSRIMFTTDGGELPGFDLDGVCTCQHPATPSCVPRTDGGCDEDGGRDNVLSKIAAQFKPKPLDFDIDQLVNEIVGDGETLLLKVDQYNGQPDDPSVLIYVDSTIRSFRYDDAGMRVKVTPKFDPSDRWELDLATAAQPGRGHVANYRLVAEMDRGITLGGRVSLSFRDGRITGTIRPPDGGPWTMEDVVVAGRWPLDQALDALGRLRGPSGLGALCLKKNALDEGAYELMRVSVCSNVDVLAKKEDDGRGYGCDSLSGGATIITAPAIRDGFEWGTHDASVVECPKTCP